MTIHDDIRAALDEKPKLTQWASVREQRLARACKAAMEYLVPALQLAHEETDNGEIERATWRALAAFREAYDA